MDANLHISARCKARDIHNARQCFAAELCSLRVCCRCRHRRRDLQDVIIFLFRRSVTDFTPESQADCNSNALKDARTARRLDLSHLDRSCSRPRRTCTCSLFRWPHTRILQNRAAPHTGCSRCLNCKQVHHVQVNFFQKTCNPGNMIWSLGQQIQKAFGTLGRNSHSQFLPRQSFVQRQVYLSLSSTQLPP